MTTASPLHGLLCLASAGHACQERHPVLPHPVLPHARRHPLVHHHSMMFHGLPEPNWQSPKGLGGCWKDHRALLLHLLQCHPLPRSLLNPGHSCMLSDAAWCRSGTAAWQFKADGAVSAIALLALWLVRADETALTVADSP